VSLIRPPSRASPCARRACCLRLLVIRQQRREFSVPRLRKAATKLGPAGMTTEAPFFEFSNKKRSTKKSSLEGLFVSLGTILLIILILILIGALPTWPHSAGWGYYPSGGLGLVLVIVLILVLLGWI